MIMTMICSVDLNDAAAVSYTITTTSQNLFDTFYTAGLPHLKCLANVGSFELKSLYRPLKTSSQIFSMQMNPEKLECCFK